MSDSPYQAARVARQAKWFTLSKIGIAVIALLTQFVLVRYLSVNDYAGYTTFFSAVPVLVFFTMYGLDRVVYRFMPPLRTEHRWREMAWFMAGMFVLRQITILLLIALCWWGIQPFALHQLFSQLAGIASACLVFSLALGCTDTFPVYCNALGQQAKQSLVSMFTTCARMLLIVFFVWQGGLNLVQITWIIAGTECLLALLLLLILLREMWLVRKTERKTEHKNKPQASREKLAFGFTLANLAKDSLSTQLAYSVALPFRGIFLRLIVASIAPPIVVASFGFFQTMADRAYQFMPMFLMKGMLEPSLASDYAQRKDYSRIRLTVSLLLRTNAVILAAGLTLLIGCGQPVIDLLTNGRYGGEVLLACLIVGQFVAITLAETLWMSLNPIGRIAFHNKLWTWFSLLCYGLLALAAYFHSTHWLVVVSCLPYLLVYLWLRYISREASLQSGFDVPRLLRLIPPIAVGSLVAQGILRSNILPAGISLTLLALTLSFAAFAVVLRAVKLFQREEVQAVASISPKLARILRLMSA